MGQRPSLGPGDGGHQVTTPSSGRVTAGHHPGKLNVRRPAPPPRPATQRGVDTEIQDLAKPGRSDVMSRFPLVMSPWCNATCLVDRRDVTSARPRFHTNAGCSARYQVVVYASARFGMSGAPYRRFLRAGAERQQLDGRGRRQIRRLASTRIDSS